MIPLRLTQLEIGTMAKKIIIAALLFGTVYGGIVTVSAALDLAAKIAARSIGI